MVETEAHREQEIKDLHDSDVTNGSKEDIGETEEAKEKKAVAAGGESEKKEENNNNNNEHERRNDGGFDPLAKLNEEQKKALEKMKEKISKYITTDEEKAWCNDMCLLRYLRARDYSVKKAKKLLKGTIQWRFKEVRPQDVKIEELEPLARLGVLYTNSFDKKGRPVVYARPYKETAKGAPPKEINGEMRFKHLLYWLEQGFKRMDESRGVESFCLIVDYKDYSRKHMDMKTNNSVMHVLLNHSPERMGITFFLDPPFLFWMGWKMMSPFLNEVTMAKVKFVYSEVKDGKRTVPAILEYVDPENLEAEYGGTSTKTYDYESFVKNGYEVV